MAPLDANFDVEARVNVYHAAPAYLGVRGWVVNALAPASFVVEAFAFPARRLITGSDSDWTVGTVAEHGSCFAFHELV